LTITSFVKDKKTVAEFYEINLWIMFFSRLKKEIASDHKMTDK